MSRTNNIGNLDRNVRTTSRISNVGRTQTRSALDIIAGNNGTFGNLSTTGAGGFDLDIPQVDPRSGMGGGTSFFTQQAKSQSQFNTTFGGATSTRNLQQGGTNTPAFATFEGTRTVPTLPTINANTTTSSSTTAPNIIIDNTPAPRPTTTTLSFGQTQATGVNPIPVTQTQDSNVRTTRSVAPAPDSTNFTTQTGAGVGQQTSDLLRAQQDAINSTLDGIAQRQAQREARLDRDAQQAASQAFAREVQAAEINRINQQDNVRNITDNQIRLGNSERFGQTPTGVTSSDTQSLNASLAAQAQDTMNRNRDAFIWRSEFTAQQANLRRDRSSREQMARLEANTSTRNTQIAADANIRTAEINAQTLADRLRIESQQFNRQLDFDYEQLNRNSESNARNRELQLFEIVTRNQQNFRYW